MEFKKNQSSAFKINFSFGFILRNNISGELRYFHSSKNVSGRFLDIAHLITDASDFQSFLDSFVQQNILSWAILQSPNSEWVCDLVTNVTFYVNLILEDLPEYLHEYLIRLSPQNSKRCVMTVTEATIL